MCTGRHQRLAERQIEVHWPGRRTDCVRGGASREPSAAPTQAMKGVLVPPQAVAQRLIDEFGPLRVKDTPISEQAIIGAAIGAAMKCMRSNCEPSAIA